MRSTFPNRPSTFHLAQGEVTSIKVRAGSCRISCQSGRVWVTAGGQASGRSGDLVLGAGDAATIQVGGTKVIEALGPSTVLLEARAADHQKRSAFIPARAVS